MTFSTFHIDLLEPKEEFANSIRAFNIDNGNVS